MAGKQDGGAERPLPLSWPHPPPPCLVGSSEPLPPAPPQWPPSPLSSAPVAPRASSLPSCHHLLLQCTGTSEQAMAPPEIPAPRVSAFQPFGLHTSPLWWGAPPLGYTSAGAFVCATRGVSFLCHPSDPRLYAQWPHHPSRALYSMPSPPCAAASPSGTPGDWDTRASSKEFAPPGGVGAALLRASHSLLSKACPPPSALSPAQPDAMASVPHSTGGATTSPPFGQLAAPLEEPLHSSAPSPSRATPTPTPTPSALPPPQGEKTLPPRDLQAPSSPLPLLWVEETATWTVPVPPSPVLKPVLVRVPPVGKKCLRHYLCPFKSCGRGFTRRDHATRHMMVHTGEKPYQCSECDMAFNRIDNLASHSLVHVFPHEKRLEWGKKIEGLRGPHRRLYEQADRERGRNAQPQRQRGGLVKQCESPEEIE